MTHGPAYRPCVGITLFNHEGKVFLGRRAGEKGEHAWQMPQGGIDDGETPLAAAIRELQEETGVVSTRLLGEAADWLSYDLPPDMLRPSWRGRYLGQSQKWFAFRLVGTEAEIDILNPAGGHKPEFEAWRWAELSETPDLVVPFKREVYKGVAKLFADFVNLK
ncbi:MAG: RNA pyrophosphohydrolase [Bosea sp. (in: a-proteobacteria)]